MKKRLSIYLSLVVLMSLTVGCSSAKLLEAENGKKYYIDTEICDRYELKKNNKLYCYVKGNECKATVYAPVCTGCTSKVCKNSNSVSK